MPSRHLRSLHRYFQYAARRCYSSANTIRGQLCLTSSEHVARFSGHDRNTNHAIAEYDNVLIRQYGDKYSRYRLSKPLRHGTDVKLPQGATIPATDIIGKRYLDGAKDSQGNAVTVHELSLPAYIANTARDATPIFPHDASTIVSLLDLHPTAPPRAADEQAPDEPPPLEIFEAGTGMGSLTLHLARAIHAANPPLPSSILQSLLTTRRRPFEDELSNHNYLALDQDAQAAYETYLASRRAIIHTLDHNKKHSHAAYNLVRNFRRAQYLPSIDFHIGTIKPFLTAELAKRDGKPFLSHAILDLPSAHEHAETVIQALRTSGLLIIFKPSVSQIGEFEVWAKETGQPIKQEKVLELSNDRHSEKQSDVGGWGGGRPWDVKIVTPKKAKAAVEGTKSEAVQVMRPTVGGLVVGGGFVAIYRRYPGNTSTQPSQKENAESEINSTVTSQEG